jgi:hypothetical protein
VLVRKGRRQKTARSHEKGKRASPGGAIIINCCETFDHPSARLLYFGLSGTLIGCYPPFWAGWGGGGGWPCALIVCALGVRVPLERVFQVLNIDGYKDPGKEEKPPKKNRPVVLHGLQVRTTHALTPSDASNTPWDPIQGSR